MNISDELRKLHELHLAGALSLQEYEIAKANLLHPPKQQPFPVAAPVSHRQQQSNPQPNGYTQEQPTESDTSKTTLLIMGYVCAGISLLFCPPGFGLAGAIIGVINVTRQRVGHGVAQIILSLVLGTAGALFGFLSATE